MSFGGFGVRLRPETRYDYQVFGTDLGELTREGPTGTFTTGSIPKELEEAAFDVVEGKPTHDLTYFNFEFTLFSGLVAIDGEGYIVWYYRAPDKDRMPQQPQAMALKPNGNILYIAAHLPATSHGLVEITPLGEEVDRLVGECPPDGPIHHEVHMLADGRVMYLSRYILRPGFGDPRVPQEADSIGIWDQTTGENRIVWKLGDFASPADRTKPSSDVTLPGHHMWAGCDRDETVQDWSHGNSTFVAGDGSVLASFRNMDQIISIAPDFQSIRWRLGGPGSDFTFPDPRDKFYHQHAAVPIPNGNVLLFDNGNFRPGKEGGWYSRALELELDLETMTARKVWEFRHAPDIFSPCCSNVHRLENGNTLVAFGQSRGELCCRVFTVVEADPAGEVVWELEHRYPKKFAQYRVYPADSIMGEARVSRR